MSSSSLNEQKSRESSHRLTDERMEQVREILFGDRERQIEARIKVLEDRLERMELSLNSRLDALQARLDAVSAKMDTTLMSARCKR